jgi:hypothetical protein
MECDTRTHKGQDGLVCCTRCTTYRCTTQAAAGVCQHTLKMPPAPPPLSGGVGGDPPPAAGPGAVRDAGQTGHILTHCSTPLTPPRGPETTQGKGKGRQHSRGAWGASAACVLDPTMLQHGCWDEAGALDPARPWGAQVGLHQLGAQGHITPPAAQCSARLHPTLPPPAPPTCHSQLWHPHTHEKEEG